MSDKGREEDVDGAPSEPEEPAGPQVPDRPAEPADADAIARVQSATWQAAYLGMLPHEIEKCFFHSKEH